ncbi:4-(cytidine 5'-diphospho)-2-C-methyl-D-erythritol kinase [Pseudogemmobacter sp. W21_MBD1_M6]|uniref:4-(cytidine 5'-diphospho)-2-C-methyl-D-erythritol kinase n=1 Tax=Pseudogemmobacter sp. W21_MBD1_M6 TaxID=3240271 RepID=UPI003F94E545
MARGFAPAKINLTLHVTGQRDDGYHLLDSLVVFAGVGDRIGAVASNSLGLSVTGPRAAGVPTDMSNLVLKAAGLFGGRTARLTLDKHLPTASGIGGGSADAAAALRVLADLYNCDMPPVSDILGLGADVPVCLSGTPARMAGIGEVLTPVEQVPDFWMVLVNPGFAVPTPAVFKALRSRCNPPMPATLPRFDGIAGFADWLAGQRNDLQSPAAALQPAIADVLDVIAVTKGCLLSRMSGSGATCFGVFGDETSATNAAAQIGAIRPDWWTVSAPRLS